MRAALLLPLLAVLGQCADRIYDEVTSLPGVTFEVNFKHYSGYLDASLGNHLYYWFFESQSNPSQAPLILWLDGGPGCASTNGMMTENGPFHPTPDGEHLQENVFSWNKIANVLYIDSPRDVGFSYRDNTQPADKIYNNSKTTDDLVLALQDFIAAYPQYKFRDFYVTGESYAGVYVPQLVDALLQTDSVQLNLKGFAIGNGQLRFFDSFNSDLDLMYYRGIISKDEFDSLYDCCTASNQTADLLYCDFSFFIEVPDNGDLNPKKFDDETLQECANHISKLGNYVWTSKNSPYNTYQDCYVDKPKPPQLRSNAVAKSYQNHENDFYDQGANQFAGSTDAMGGFPCYMYDATEKYFNLPGVRKALHISENMNKWMGCSDLVAKNYAQNELDMTDVFYSIMDSGAELRALIYNGDLDLACSFLADQWFVERIVSNRSLNVVTEREEWLYKRNTNMPAAGGGYVKRFGSDSFKIDLVEVKGAGHHVPLDRPGPALQMFNNFLFGLKSYNNVANISTAPAPLLKEFQTSPEPQLSRKEVDRIFDLPGLTFKLNFDHYAGYLSGVKGNYLHYWFVESQRDPERDPLVLWLSGGPGCSGYTALLWGNGPFRANRDGTTLFENVYSWNKIANVIFIDSPRGVGYSFQNTTENPSTDWNDDSSSEDLKLAIIDFLDIYPEYKHRPFYLAGESYGGVYAPSTAIKLIDLIQSGDLPYLNFQGVATGNALLSSYDNFNAQIQYQYFHGAIGKDDWDDLQQCCPQSQQPADPAYFEFCDFSQFVQFTPYGLSAFPKDPNDICAKKTINITLTAWAGPQTQFNLYVSCYDISNYNNDRPGLVKPFYKNGFVDQARLVSHEVSDSQDGQFCWGQQALKKYMNTDSVQAALHVKQGDKKKDKIEWTGCSNRVSIKYRSQYFDMRPFYRKMIDWGKPFKFLIYNGDIDMTCPFLGGQRYGESLAQEYEMDLTKDYSQWTYLEQIGGYAEQFKTADGHITMDIVTVKGAGHFAALDRPGPALQVFSSFIDNQPLDNKASANLELADLLKRYSVEEEVGREKDLPVDATTKTRAKRAAAAALPAPPPACSKKDNEVINLPGLTFDLGVKHYSGYLNSGTGDYLHYWLIEAEKEPEFAPLILWFNGGPGCSSLSGLLGELGPFHNNPDGETLYENVFSWHKVGNLLFLESPRGIGFSYQASDSNPGTVNDYSDTLTAEGNVQALVDFLNCYPEYKDTNRKLFITGESYAGVYIPTFVDLLLKKVQDGSVTGVNLEGIAIGNGAFSTLKDVSSSISLTYMRGMHSRKEFEALGKCVPADYKGPMTYYDFTNYVNINKFGLPIPKSLNTSTLEGFCGTEVLRQGYLDVWLAKNDVYNTYQDCYARHPLPAPGDQDAISNGQSEKKEERERRKRDAIGRAMNYNPFIDEGKRMNYQSTDNNGGIYCYDGKTPYLNRPEVRKAINIPDFFTKPWVDCDYQLELTHYHQEYNDTTPVFESIFSTVKSLGKPLRMLIYHGDADMACQFLAGQWFIEDLAKKNNMELTTDFTPWNFEMQQGSKMSNIGGFQKSWSDKDGQVTIDLLTIKGAGHMVPTDRPGEALQMFYNFVRNVKQQKNPVDYNIPLWKGVPNIERKPLKSEYLSPPVSIVSRADADRIYDLPGLTYDYPFDQWSGYLQASKGNKLFYWFFQSQNIDPSAPVVLWLNGGPGCSSLIGLLTENGPFRVNPDQRTLWENVYSWNKAAHVLYIDSPRKVGFSYQNMTENPSREQGDDLVAPDAWLALEDFFTIFPEMKKREFYISGESYCGIYLPLITTYVAQKIESGESTINLKGMIIGNGQVSFKQDMRTMPSFSYMHGIIGKAEYDSLADCCIGNETLGGLYCHYDEFFVNAITWTNKPDLDEAGKQCARNLKKIAGAEGAEWSDTNDAYNLYQDCYTTEKSLFSVSKSETSYKSRILAMRRRERARKAMEIEERSELKQEEIEWGILDPLSTDNTKGYQCWMDDATTAFLQLPHIRTALHVPDYAPKWEECANIPYKQNKEDMSEQFEYLMNSPLDLRVLLYNGDIDDVCQLQQAQWFVETLAHKHGWTESDKIEWHYRGVIGGYQTKYKTDTKFTLDLLTVKGAGHMVPTDRPGPALQMIDNFLRKKDFDTQVPYSMERRPLLPQYARKGDVSSNDSSSTIPPSPSPSSSVSTTTTTTTTTTTKMTPTSPSDASSSPSDDSVSSTPPSSTMTTTQPPTTTSVGSSIGAFISLVLLFVSFL